MTIDRASLGDLFEQSLTSLLSEDVDTILADVSERNSCGRLAMHMTTLLPQFGLDGYIVDPEYNRNHGEIKTIIDGHARILRITCDLILHSRGREIAHDNLIAVEFKKFDRPESEKAKDRERLEALTRQSFDGVYSNDGITIPQHVCGYEFGAFVQLNRDTRRCLIDYFQDGACIGHAERFF